MPANATVEKNEPAPITLTAPTDAFVTSSPTVSGEAVVGRTLTVEAGEWSPEYTLAYQWLADGLPLEGAAGSTLVLGPDLAGKAISVQVTGSQPGYAPETRTSEPSVAVLNVATPAEVAFADADGTANDTFTVPSSAGVDYRLNGETVPAGTYPGTGTVTVTAAAKEGFVLAPDAAASWTATFKTSPYSVSPAEVVFSDQLGTKDDTYTVPATPGVDYLVAGKVVAAGTYPGVGTVTVTAAAQTDFVVPSTDAASWTFTFKGDLIGAAPKITGTPKVGYLLTAVPGTWSPTPDTLSYQWYRAGVAVAGATAATYRLPASAAGATYSVRVTASKAGYASLVKASAATAVVAYGSLVGAAPRIIGTSKVGYALTAVPGTWSPAPVTLRYQWYRSGVAVVGATAATYRLPASAAGARYSVRITGSKSGYTTLAKVSGSTIAVAKGTLAGPAPRIAGTAKVGYVLTAIAGAWSPAPVTLRYQWYRSGVAIVGATAATYRLPASAAGARYSVRITGSKSGYTTSAKVSGSTAAVAKGSLAGPAPRITGTAKVGYVLTAIAGAWSPAPVAVRYQWYRSGVAVVGATAASYRLPARAAGATYTVRVTGSKTGYNTLAKTSAATARIATAYVPPAPAAYYANCTAVRNAGKAPLYSWQPGYRSALDRDSDGIACE
ncbi:excalibur calcium-binding domain-containing protein [Arthrobacter sp. FW305-BF8]|uniref:excalibur calcium-binding domain-containing protein n=1 Tax=Arthrobacter sp. FW305-BF8 TaxID=2879617 RepID=UPI001F2F8671|nr:excalibur calcium-binding domain-containing protein [Arthrobacter sp. FW305-BF8]UKA55556.1 excalibur calcium-binding domain-containing protein [Arthrobacter sp. FW305-BF8]